jgi:HEAT repeat protein
LIAIGGAVGLVIASFCVGEREPAYKGKTLSQWLEIFEKDRGLSGGMEEVRNIGTNAVPLLLTWLRREQPAAWRTNLAVFTRKFPGSIGKTLSEKLEPRTELCRRRAMTAFWMLGPEASSAIPELTRMMDEGGNSWGRAVSVLGNLGREAIPPLVRVVKNEKKPLILRCAAARQVSQMAWPGPGRGAFANPAECWEVIPALIPIVTNSANPTAIRCDACETIAFLGQTGTNESLVLPVLIKCLEDNDVDLACLAAGHLPEFTGETNLVVAALIDSLSDSRPKVGWVAASSLGKIGAGANAALSALREATNSPDLRLRNAATDALLEIPAHAVPVFIERLRSLAREPQRSFAKGQSFSNTAIELARFGEDARPAVPILLECLTNNDPKVAASAALTLGNLGLDADKVIPPLTSLLVSTNIGVRNCGAIGLEKLLDDPVEKVRRSATNALTKIESGETVTRSWRY